MTSEETRSRLLAAAAEAFAARGYDGVRVAEIATAAGLSNGALYSHFDSKADLLAAALGCTGSQALAEHFPEADTRSSLELLVAVGEQLNGPGRPRGDLITAALVAARRDETVAAVITAHLAERVGHLGSLLRAGQASGEIDAAVSPEALTRWSLMTLLGAMLLAPLDLPPVDEEEWKALLRTIASALGPRQSSPEPTEKDAP